MVSLKSAAGFAIAGPALVSAANNGLARTPTMGINMWLVHSNHRMSRAHGFVFRRLRRSARRPGSIQVSFLVYALVGRLRVCRNSLFCNYNVTDLEQIASLLVSDGYAAAGYTQFNLDDCWQSGRMAK